MSTGPASARPLSLGELARELPMTTRIEGDPAVRVKGVCHDSRVIARGELFVARSGEHFDGARFVADAVARGASAVMAAPGSLDPGAVAVPVLFASDPARALAFAASAVYGHPSFTVDVVGVTGTNGKTTTVHLVRAAIDGALGLPATGVLGTVGHRYRDWHRPAAHTTPEADDLQRLMLAMKRAGASCVAMEVSSIAIAAKRTAAVRFTVAALTNLTQDHLDYHGTMEAYAAEKAKLFVDYGPGNAVVCVDHAFGRSLFERVTG
ncbi:MAG: Mur ligase family protein, partial [Polyangiaceae bacterium]